MRLFDTTPRRSGNSLTVLLVCSHHRILPSPLPVEPPNAVTRSRREYHYACPFSSRIAHHRLCNGFLICSEYPFRLLAPLCCSRTNVCSQIIGYLIFKEHLPQEPGAASDASFRVKSRRMLSIISRSSPDNVFESRFNMIVFLAFVLSARMQDCINTLHGNAVHLAQYSGRHTAFILFNNLLISSRFLKSAFHFCNLR